MTGKEGGTGMTTIITALRSSRQLPAALHRFRPAIAKQAPPRGRTGQLRVHDAVDPGHDRPHGLPPGYVLDADARARQENRAITSMHIPFGINTMRETQVRPPIDRSRQAA